jgi:hypothetical protein
MGHQIELLLATGRLEQDRAQEGPARDIEPGGKRGQDFGQPVTACQVQRFEVEGICGIGIELMPAMSSNDWFQCPG